MSEAMTDLDMEPEQQMQEELDRLRAEVERSRLDTRGFVPASEHGRLGDLYQQAKAEVERLKPETEVLDGIAYALESRGWVHCTNGEAVGMLVDSYEAEKARAERLEAALEKYGAHLPRCPQGAVSQYESCTCGLQKALEEGTR